jgi:signal transduction histidine kinase/HAMP domain-containing protein
MLKLFKSTISLKLKLIIISVTTIVLSLAILLVILNENTKLRTELANNTLLNTKLVGEYAVPTLVFNDDKGCYEILSKIESIPYITEIIIYDTTLKEFSKYIKNSEKSKLLNFSLQNLKDTIIDIDGILHVIKPIIYQNANYGYIYIKATEKFVIANMVDFTYLMVIILISSIIISYFLAVFLEKIISKPILQLASITKHISISGDFEHPLEVKGNDEIGILYQEFNHLMKEIVIRNAEKEQNAVEIIKLNEELEAKVLDRTARLQEALINVEDENKQRKVSEELLKKSNIELEQTKQAIENDSLKLIELNRKLTQSEIELKALNSTKDRFFSIISHDLKNPLSTFRQITRMLYDDYATFEEQERISFLEAIKKSSENLYDLLWNLLEWSKSQSGKLPFNIERFDLSIIIKNSIGYIQQNAEKKNISIINKIYKNYFIKADPNLLTAVLIHTLSNSVKFTQNGGSVEIAVKPSVINKKEEYIREVQISVKDNGMGISDDILTKLFRIDSHISSLGTNKEMGNGLGLILCKEFIEKHQGKIWIDTEVSIGTIVNFTLPNKEI